MFIRRLATTPLRGTLGTMLSAGIFGERPHLIEVDRTLCSGQACNFRTASHSASDRDR
jgi:hypothetical protein